MKINKSSAPIWRCSNGEILSCTEKIKVMRENLEELEQAIQDAYTDALLMNVDAQQFKQFLINLVENLHNPYE